MYLSDRAEIIDMCKSASYSVGFPTVCFLIIAGDGYEFKDDYPWK